jgi:hypothetical protein
MSDKLEVVKTANAVGPADMLQAVIQKGVTAENVEVFQKLWALHAEREFAAAFVKFQSELPLITASTVIPNRGKYEKYEDLMKVVGPILTRNGFSVSYDQENKDGRVTEIVHLTHVGGFTRTNNFAVRTGRKADSEAQADCMASTTAKRNALCNALNIVIQQDCLDSDHDATIEGGKISEQQAESLRQRVMATASDEAAFLKLAGAREYKDIRVAFYQMLDLCLKRREKLS